MQVVYSKKPNNRAGYILRDGRFINFVEQTQIKGHEKLSHNGFDRYVSRQTGRAQNYKHLLYEHNAIAFNDTLIEKAIGEFAPIYVDLPFEEPTAEQYKSLLEWLYHTMYVSKTIDVNGPKFQKYEFLNPNNDTGYLPEDIIKEIKKMYVKQKEEILCLH